MKIEDALLISAQSPRESGRGIIKLRAFMGPFSRCNAT